MTSPYTFGFGQEDERTEATALGLPGGRVLAIAAAGEMPLSLLALGAERVDAVDVSPGQLHLVRLKLAAVERLDREDAIRFLGFLPATHRERRRWLGDVASALPAPSREFWRRHEAAALGGAIWAGSAERLLRLVLRPAIRALFGRADVDGLLRAGTRSEQERVFARHGDGALLRGLFRIVFAPRLFRLRGMAQESVRYRGEQRSLGGEYLDRFRSFCTATPARDNHLLHLCVAGQLPSTDCAPYYLTHDGFAALRQRLGAITLVERGVVEHLASSPARRYDKVHLSNVVDWLEPPTRDQLFQQLVRVVARPGWVVWRYIHREPSLAGDQAGALRVDRELATALEARDRFPFFRIVPAVL